MWLLGNLARATYVGSSDYMWPWSYAKCDPTSQVSQEISSCNNAAHWGMHGGEGRGAPEIDIIEAMPGERTKLPNTKITKPYVSSSLQVSPGVRSGRPNPGALPNPAHWYTGMSYGTNTSLNPFFYGVTLEHTPKAYTYQSDAVSANTGLGETHFKNMHKFRVEWEPPSDGGLGYIRWYMDGEFMYSIEVRTHTRVRSPATLQDRLRICYSLAPRARTLRPFVQTCVWLTCVCVGRELEHHRVEHPGRADVLDSEHGDERHVGLSRADAGRMQVQELRVRRPGV